MFLYLNVLLPGFSWNRPIGKGSEVDQDFLDLSRKSRLRLGKGGKVYSFFHKMFAPKAAKQEVTKKIDRVVAYLESEPDISSIEDVIKILSRFRFDEFNREKIPTSLQKRLISDVRGSETSKIAKLSVRLGIDPILNGKGVHSSKIYFNLGVRPIAIYKSGELCKSKTWERRVATFVRENKLIRTQDSFLPIQDQRPKAAMISERATYLLANILGHDLVPTTEVLQMDGERGSFQHFVAGYREAGEVELPSLKNASEEDLTKFQIFALFDYLTGGLDRKEDNWLVQLDSTAHIQDIKMIDNGNNFAAEHVPRSARIASRYQYKWKNLPLAEGALTDAAKAFIGKITERKITEFFKEVGAEFGEDAGEFFSDAVLSTFQDRLEVLRSFQSGDRSLVDLAAFSTPEAFALRTVQ